MKKCTLTRCFSLLLSLCLFYSFIFSSFAVTPRWQALSTMLIDIDISASGYAQCFGAMTMDLGYTGNLTMELQQEDRGRWLTIKEWSDSGRNIALEKGYFVEEGYDYRTKVSVSVYDEDGIYVESATGYSGVQSYP